MPQRHALFSTAAVLALAAGLGAMAATPARADTITPIDISSAYNGSWSGEINGAAIQTAIEGGVGNTGTGLSFSDPTGQYAWIDGSTAISFGGVALTGNSTVQALFNQFYGNNGASITFLNSNNATDVISLVANVTIRDYNNGIFNDGLSGSGTNVSAEPWWTTGDGASNGNGQPSQRLDAQIFTLPSSWAGTSLVGIQIDNDAQTSGYPDATVLSALNVDAGSPVTPTVPEPMSLAILAPALLGLVAIRRRAVANG